ncbi:MAG: hypothetical protein E7675_04690 [Ruminococcaceae bacterium]|nr:hypothetical protein [Oscillospiraceae bacterium]
MKKLNRSAELLWIFGVVFVSLGVCICSKADLGVSMIAAPAFIVSELLSPISAFFSVGVTEYLIQGVLLIILCILIRKFNWRFLLAFLVGIIYGYTLNLFLWLFRDVTFEQAWLRWLMLLVGDIITGFGVACFFRTYMPLQVYELFVSKLSETFKLNINRVKWIFDLSLLVLSLTMALTLFGDAGDFNLSSITHTSFHSIGLGTFVTTAINSPIITFSGKIIDRLFSPTPLFLKLNRFLKKN